MKKEYVGWGMLFTLLVILIMLASIDKTLKSINSAVRPVIPPPTNVRIK